MLAERESRRLVETLSGREIEVLGLLAEGLQDKEIARRLWISTFTVKTHVKHILQKLDARNRAHAVANGFRLGLTV